MDLFDAFLQGSTHSRRFKAKKTSALMTFAQKIRAQVPLLFGAKRTENYPHLLFVQVLGTNGKGSTCERLLRSLHQEGMQTFLFTSPHLCSLQERFIANGRSLPYDAYSTWERLEGLYYDHFFEKMCAFAVWYIAYGGGFDPQKPLVGIFEAGLGGRFDMTSALEMDLQIFLEIGEDHQQILGYSFEERLREKVMALRPTVKKILIPCSWEPLVFEASSDWGNQGDFAPWDLRSFAQQWSAFVGVPYATYRDAKTLLSRARFFIHDQLGKSGAVLRRDAAKARAPVRPFRARAFSGGDPQLERVLRALSWDHVLFDSAHNASALSYLIGELEKKSTKDRHSGSRAASKYWLLLALERSRSRFVNWVELGSFFDQLILVDNPAKQLLTAIPWPKTARTASPMLSPKGDAVSISVGSRDVGASNVAQSGVFIAKRLAGQELQKALEHYVDYLELATRGDMIEQEWGEVLTHPSAFSCLEYYASAAKKEGVHLIVAGSFYWMGDLMRELFSRGAS